MSLFLTDLVGVGPQPAAYWVLWKLAVFYAEELCCSLRQAPVWYWTFLQPSGWTALPCSPTLSASLSAPAKNTKERSNINAEEQIYQYKRTGSVKSHRLKRHEVGAYVSKKDEILYICRVTCFPKSGRWTHSSFDVGVHYHLDLLARLGHIFQHAESIFVLAAHHQLLQSYKSVHHWRLWGAERDKQIKIKKTQ